MTSLWPLFELRLETPRLVLRPPTDDDLPGLLDAIDAGIHDPQLMPFSIPWTDADPAERRFSALQFVWRARANWSKDEWDLPFGVFRDGAPIGVQGVTAKRFPLMREVETGSWLTRVEQGQGYGKEMRAAVLKFAFESLVPSWPGRPPSSTTRRRRPCRAPSGTARTDARARRPAASPKSG